MRLITGPTGNVGDELVEVLGNNPPRGGWRVACRHPEEVRSQLGDGVDVCGFDFFDRST